jgi:alkylation response protein AidB-like acyl-CoA dehydrogenase
MSKGTDGAGTIVAGEELVARAHAMIPRLRLRQAEVEAARRVPEETFRELLDADLYKALAPTRYGGFEHGLDTYVDIACEIARGCGSTGWVHAITSKYNILIGMFPAEAQEEFWGDGPDVVSAAAFTPTGTAVPVDGGYRLGGKWMFCSGVDNCQWIAVVANLADGDGSFSGKGFALVPVTEFEVEDNWHVVGLAGTGSKNIHCEDIFVPAHRFLTMEDAVSGRPPGVAVNPGPLYRIPVFSMVSISLCAAVMGMAQGALDEFVGDTRERVTRGAALSQPVGMAEIPTVQLRVGEAAASIEAARRLVDRDCKEIMATMTAGRELTIEQRARNKGHLAFAARLSVRAVDLLFEGGGGGALFSQANLQRFWRDIHAGAMHISMSWDAVGALYGRVTLGLPPGPAQF